MDIEASVINRILEKSLREIYDDRFIKTDIISIMQYPMKENLFIVTYNIDLVNSHPIIRAKIIVDVNTEGLKTYDPGLP